MEQKMLNLLLRCRSIRELKQTHLQILVQGLHENSFILPKLITLSSEVDSHDYAFRVFENSKCPNVIAYNTMIKCSTGKNHEAALRIYRGMKISNVAPNSFTFTFLVRCFQSFESFECGEVTHGEIVKLGFASSVFVVNTLLDFYAKCGGNLDSACKLFDEMPERDVVSWNSIICAYMACGEIESAIGLFNLMPERNIVTWNSVVSGLSKAGNMEQARSVFERMPERNEVSWNSMISGFIKIGDMEAAECIFQRIPEKTVISWTAMITGYTMIGDLKSASNFFDQMPVKNVISWNAMIAGYVHNHMFDQAFSVFNRMLIDRKCKPDQTTLISMLSACTHLGSLEHGKWIDNYIKKNKYDLSAPLGNALIDMFAKCGDAENAKVIFDRMPRRCIITWTTIVSGLALNGQCREALALFDRMCLEGIKPDDVIFIAVLAACTHGGLVDEGKRVFYQMMQKFNIMPRIEHYGCMVDLLGRAGKLEEAVRFMDKMHLKPNAVIWASLLGSCKIHRNGALLETVTRKILDQDPANPGYFILLSNLSATIGQGEDALSFRVAMREQGIEKVPGCSLIQVGHRVHEFLAKDTRHEQRREIYKVLGSLNGHLKAIYATP